MNRGVRPERGVMSTGSTKPLKWFATSSTGRPLGYRSSPATSTRRNSNEAANRPTQATAHASAHGGSLAGAPGRPMPPGLPRRHAAWRRGPHATLASGPWPRRATAPAAPAGHVPGLDGARALATLSVFFFHALWRTPALDPLRPVLGARRHRRGGVLHPVGLPGGAAARWPTPCSGARPVRFGRLLAAAHRPHLAGVPRGARRGGGHRHRHGRRASGDGSSTGCSSTAGSATAAAAGCGSSWTLVVEVAFYALVLPLAAVVLLAGRRPLDAWIVAVPRLVAYGSWALALTTQHHTALGPRAAPLPPGLRGGDAARGRRAGRRPGHVARRHAAGDPPGRGAPDRLLGAGGRGLRRHGGRCFDPEHDHAGVRARARAAGAVVPTGPSGRSRWRRSRCARPPCRSCRAGC